MTEIVIPYERLKVQNTGAITLYLLADGFQPNAAQAKRVSGWIIPPGGDVQLYGTTFLFTNFVIGKKGKLVIYPIGAADGDVTLSQI
ncbi:hypothetical protein [Calothrix sp. NIES-2098]|uniref:hypothetical protein n=1 Tax=Calothrix sp. NIES-2098 TaxID=1954171 RepID=UPI000BBB9F9B